MLYCFSEVSADEAIAQFIVARYAINQPDEFVHHLLFKAASLIQEHPLLLVVVWALVVYGEILVYPHLDFPIVVHSNHLMSDVNKSNLVVDLMEPFQRLQKAIVHLIFTQGKVIKLGFYAFHQDPVPIEGFLALVDIVWTDEVCFDQRWVILSEGVDMSINVILAIIEDLDGLDSLFVGEGIVVGWGGVTVG